VRRAHTRTAALLTAVAIPLTACSGDAAPRAQSPAVAGSESAPATSSTAPQTPEDQIEAALAGMSREQQIAQLFLVGVPLEGLGLGRDLASAGVGGIFLAGRSQLPAGDLAATAAAWQAAAGTRDVWIAVDQEGGNVQTLSGPGFTELPTAQEQSQLPADELAVMAEGLGAELASAGVNLNLAPVADVVPAGTEHSNEPIGAFGRQYGATPEDVAAAAGVVVDGLAEHGVTAVLKHFPGLGRVRGNTDTRDQVVDPVTKPDDAQVRLFADLAEDADATPFVMTSSAVYPAIDEIRPAGWSSVVVDDLLRDELGFDGVVVSDDVGAAAAVQDVPPGVRAIRCLEAGGTLVLTVDPALYPEMLDAVVARDRTDDAFSARIDDAVRTALLAKVEAGLLGP
jgi:beta-N-acetylhexosaminidase